MLDRSEVSNQIRVSNPQPSSHAPTTAHTHTETGARTPTIMASLERELLALAAKYEQQDDPVDVLEALSDKARLLAATERLRRLMKRDAASAGGADGLFALRQRTEDGAVELVGEGGRLARRMRVREHEDLRLLDGTTTIRARVELLPRGQAEEEEEENGEAVQLWFEFSRKPGPRRGGSMPYPAAAAELEEKSGDGSSVGSESGGEEGEGSSSSSGSSESVGSGAHCCGGGGGGGCGGGNHHHGHGHGEEEDGDCGGAAPTTIVQYSIRASPSVAEPPVEILSAVIFGLHPSGAPSPRGIRGPADDEEEEAGEEGTSDPRDLGLVELDDEALQAAMAWCSGGRRKSGWSEVQFLNFLLFFPYYEEEWNVPGLVMDEIFGKEGESEEEGEEEEEEEEEEDSSEAEEEAIIMSKPAKRKQEAGQAPSPPKKRGRQQ